MTAPEEQAAEVLDRHRACHREGRAGDRITFTCGIVVPLNAASPEAAHLAAALAPLFAEERRKAWSVGKHADHTPTCRFGDGDCICPNPYERADTYAEGGERAMSDLIARNLRVFKHEAPMRGHDADGECCRRAALGAEPAGHDANRQVVTR